MVVGLLENGNFEGASVVGLKEGWTVGAADVGIFEGVVVGKLENGNADGASVVGWADGTFDGVEDGI